ncbi:MAG: hypothetical protein V1743_06750 [Nanoarchaeota archaeon]
MSFKKDLLDYLKMIGRRTANYRKKSGPIYDFFKPAIFDWFCEIRDMDMDFKDKKFQDQILKKTEKILGEAEVSNLVLEDYFRTFRSHLKYEKKLEAFAKERANRPEELGYIVQVLPTGGVEYIFKKKYG